MSYRLTRSAQHQIDAILATSERLHGIDAAERYGLLLVVTMAAIGDQPSLLGATSVPGNPGVKAYPIRLGNGRIPTAQRVRAPRHLIVYRVAPDGVVQILGLAHDRMILSRAAQRAVQDANMP